MTFEHRTLPAYLALCLGVACAFALLPAIWAGAAGSRGEPGVPGGKAQQRIAPGWSLDAPVLASEVRVTRLAMETRP